jgi:hypothetical protein
VYRRPFGDFYDPVLTRKILCRKGIFSIATDFRRLARAVDAHPFGAQKEFFSLFFINSIDEFGDIW